MNASDKTSLLISLIDDLCRKDFVSSSSKSNAIQTLQKVYDGTYRHSYSDIFNKLQQVFERDSEVTDTLGENLNVLKNELAPSNDEPSEKAYEKILPDDLHTTEVSGVEQNDNTPSTVVSENAERQQTPISQAVVNGFAKLCDYIQIEIARNNQFQTQLKELTFREPVSGHDEQANKEINKKIIEVSDNLKDAQRILDQIPVLRADTKRDIEKFDEKLESSKVSSITDLSIFSAVILAFSGGITFEAGVFQGISGVSAFRLVFIVSLTGFILFNTIFALLYLVSRIAGKSVESTCKYASKENSKSSTFQKCGCDYCERPLGQVTLFCRIKHKFTYVLIINLVFVMVMFEDFVLWSFQNTPWSLSKILVLSIPVFMIIVFALVLLLDILIQKHRGYVLLRNQLVLSIQQSNNLILGFSKFFKTFAESLLLHHQEDFLKEANSISEIIDTEKANKKPCFCRLRKNIRIFVIENAEQHPEHMNKISFTAHQRNKRIWRKIKKFLKNTINK